jgi:transcriptional regulator with XRE-family HTH domain
MSDIFKSMIAGLSNVGMTQSDIARQSGVSRQTIWRLETGEAREPTYDTFVKLDRVYRAAVPVTQRTPVQKTRL